MSDAYAVPVQLISSTVPYPGHMLHNQEAKGSKPTLSILQYFVVAGGRDMLPNGEQSPFI